MYTISMVISIQDFVQTGNLQIHPKKTLNRFVWLLFTVENESDSPILFQKNHANLHHWPSHDPEHPGFQVKQARLVAISGPTVEHGEIGWPSNSGPVVLWIWNELCRIGCTSIVVVVVFVAKMKILIGFPIGIEDEETLIGYCPKGSHGNLRIKKALCKIG